MVKQTLEKPKKKIKKPKKSSKRTKTQHVYVHVKNETTGATRGMGSMGSIGPHYAISSPLRPQESTLKSEVQNLKETFKPYVLSLDQSLKEKEIRDYHNLASAREPIHFAGKPRPSDYLEPPKKAVDSAVKAQLGDDKREKSILNMTAFHDAKSIDQARRQALLNPSIQSFIPTSPRIFEEARQRGLASNYRSRGVRVSSAEMSEAGNIGYNGYNSTKKSATDGDRFAEGSSGRNEGKPKSPSKVSKTPIEKAVSGESVGDAGTGISASISHATDLVVQDFTNEETGVGLMGGTEPGLNPFTASAGASAGLSAGDLLAQTREEPIEPLTPYPSQISKKSEMGTLKPAQKEVANAMQSQLLANEGQSVGSEGIAPQISGDYGVGRSRLSNRLRALTSESKPAVTSKPGKKSDRLPSFNDSLGNTVGAEVRFASQQAEEKLGNDLEAYPGDREA